MRKVLLRTFIKEKMKKKSYKKIKTEWARSFANNIESRCKP